MVIDGKALKKACSNAPRVKTNGELSPAKNLCRDGIEEFLNLAKKTDELLIACTQEAPIFLDALDEINDESTKVRFTNIREKAGWSGEASGNRQKKKNLTAKMAAILAEAALDIEDSQSVTMTSNGILLILGRDADTLEVAKKLSNRLEATVILEPGTKASPPKVMEFPIFTGKITSAYGHLGQFQITYEDFTPANPSSGEHLSFTGKAQNGTIEADLILDLRGAPPLFPSPEKRDGYFNPDPNSSLQIANAMFELSNLIGTFEKPRYLDYDDTICAHSRATIIGCTRCIDNCPTSAIKSEGEVIQYDPYICAGCGTCASICPTGAIRYNLPAGETLINRLRTQIKTYNSSGGSTPRLLLHDTEYGEEIINLIARAGNGLPSNILPFAVNQVTQIGIDFLLAASSYGAERVIILLPPNKADERNILNLELELAEVILDGLGYGTNHFDIVEQIDPEEVEKYLYNLIDLPSLPDTDFLPLGRKRSIMRLALDELYKYAPTPVDIVELPITAPFGTVNINTDNCTLCLACVGSCPTGALQDNKEKPQLSFTESACVQCGLCKNTCPENVISLTPRLNFLSDSNEARIIKEEEPFECIRCGKPFGAKSSIEKMVTKLENHPMFQEKGGTDRLKMCDDCRVLALAEEDEHPMAIGARPAPRTTADYLEEREELRQKATNDMIKKGLVEDETNGDA